MKAGEIADLTALGMARAIRSRELSPTEALEACLASVDELNPLLNAIVWRDDERARDAARSAEDTLVHSTAEELPPFHGVPIPIKDLTEVAGWPVTYGSAASAAALSAESEIVVRALERAGFVLACRTNTPEFGELPATENLRYGLTRNPWDTTRTPGGSSGGAAAAVASGMFPVAHANDGGGSIRIPASCCGLVGLKPSRGRVPSRVFSWEGAAVEGVLTRDVADAAAILDCICGPDPTQWYNAPTPERPFATDVGADPGRLRIGMVTEAPLGLPIEAECLAALEEAARTLESVGHDVAPLSGLFPEELAAPFLDVVNASLADFEGIDWSLTEPHTQAAHAAALGVDSFTYVRSVHELQKVSRSILGRFGAGSDQLDLLLTPTMTILPPAAGEVLAEAHQAASTGGPPMKVLQMAAITSPFNVTGQPAVSLPTHMSKAGVPVGVQLVGGPFGEPVLLRLASQLEAALPWSARKPPVRRATT